MDEKIAIKIRIRFYLFADRAKSCAFFLYNNQINARALIGQSAMVYCAGKPMEKSRVRRIIT